jgi:hypothetical protein
LRFFEAVTQEIMEIEKLPVITLFWCCREMTVKIGCKYELSFSMNLLSAFISILRAWERFNDTSERKVKPVIENSRHIKECICCKPPFEAALSKKCLSVNPRMKGTPELRHICLDIPRTLASGQESRKILPCDVV